jgi:transcriptional regulator
MRDNPLYASDDDRLVRELIAANPWATIVSATRAGLVASHYPVLLDHAPELALLMHVGRPDEEIHGFGSSEVLVIIAGAHGYISPSWYSLDANPVPTWNFIVAHCYGTPRLLDDDENRKLLTRLTAHFEQHVENPVHLGEGVAGRLGPATAGFRVPIERFICKVKMSQDEDPNTQARVLAALGRPGPYSNPALAEQMQTTLESAGLRDRGHTAARIDQNEGGRGELPRL